MKEIQIVKRCCNVSKVLGLLLMVMLESGYSILKSVLLQMSGTKVLKLPTLLEGEALMVWWDLKRSSMANYAIAKKNVIS